MHKNPAIDRASLVVLDEVVKRASTSIERSTIERKKRPTRKHERRTRTWTATDNFDHDDSSSSGKPHRRRQSKQKKGEPKSKAKQKKTNTEIKVEENFLEFGLLVVLQ